MIEAWTDFISGIFFHGPLSYFIVAGVLVVVADTIVLAVARYTGEDENPMVVLLMGAVAVACLAWGGILLMAPLWMFLMVSLWVLQKVFLFSVGKLFKAVDKLKAHNEKVCTAKALAEKKEAKRLHDIERRRKFDESKRTDRTVE